MMTLLSFVVAIALLVLFHELGHYWVARRCGVKVLRFSLGFGKVIYSRRFSGSDTEWVVSAIPLGGYVKMLDEREEPVAPDELAYAFNRKPVLQRMAIVVAGPMANFLLAILLYWVLFVHGVPGLRPVLADVPSGTAAAIAGMQPGETIIYLNDEKVPSWLDLRWSLLNHALKHEEVEIRGQAADGAMLVHVLDISGLEAKDLDGEFIEKLGLRLYQPVILPIIGSLTEGDIAQQAGMQTGDHILRANGVVMRRWMEVVEVIRSHPGEPIQFDLQRGESQLTITITPRSDIESGKAVGKIGAGPKVDEAEWKKMFVEVSYPPLDAMRQSLRKTWETTDISLKMMFKMVMGEVSMKNLSGPITIADYAGQSAAMGVVAYLGFLALVSISLGVLNLLPIPILDGGHLLYYVAELLKGSPVSERTWEIGQNIGIALLGTLMVFAVYNDINRLVSG